MIRRAVCFLAATVMALLLVLSPGVPAFARQVPVKDPCTVQEWQRAKNFAECAKRAFDTAQRQVDCIKAPTPSSPDAGLAGWVTSRPDNDYRSGVPGRYSHYGVGGYRLSLYDMSCASSVTSPVAAFESEVGSIAFGLAAFTVGLSNALREWAYNPQSAWGWSDGFVEDATRKSYEYVFSVFGIISLALCGLWLLVQARNGQLSKAVQTAGWAVLVMVAVSGLAKYPSFAVHSADNVAVTGLSAMHNALGPAPADIPLDQCAFAEDNPDACIDHRTVSVRSADTITEAVLYRSWLRAVLGSDDSEVAKKYGNALYDASTFSWAEAADIDKDPAQRPVIIKLKGEQWIGTAEAIKAEDPEAYEYLQGARGSDRIWAGIGALLSALAYVLFDNAASLVILISFGLVRFAVMVAPVLATVGIVRPASRSLRWVFNAAVAAVFNIILFGAGAGLYLWIVDVLSASELPGGAQVIAVFLAGIICLLLLRPFRRIIQLGRRPKVTDGDADSVDAGSAATGSRWQRAASWVGSVVGDAARQAAADAMTRRGPIFAEAETGPPRPEAAAMLTAGRSGGRR